MTPVKYHGGRNYKISTYRNHQITINASIPFPRNSQPHIDPHPSLTSHTLAKASLPTRCGARLFFRAAISLRQSLSPASMPRLGLACNPCAFVPSHAGCGIAAREKSRRAPSAGDFGRSPITGCPGFGQTGGLPGSQPYRGSPKIAVFALRKNLL